MPYKELTIWGWSWRPQIICSKIFPLLWFHFAGDHGWFQQIKKKKRKKKKIISSIVSKSEAEIVRESKISNNKMLVYDSYFRLILAYNNYYYEYKWWVEHPLKATEIEKAL